MNTVKKIITPIFILLMSMTFFMQSVCAMYFDNVTPSASPKSIYYGLEETKIYSTSFQFRTTHNRLMSCVVSAYADSNVEICVYGNPVVGDDVYGSLLHNTQDFVYMNDWYLSNNVFPVDTQTSGDITKYTFHNYETNDDVPLINILLINDPNTRFLNKTITVFGKSKIINLKDKFMEIADMDEDGCMTLSDVMSVMEKYRNVQLFGMPYHGTKGDMNKDGTITMGDVQDALDMYTQVVLFN